MEKNWNLPGTFHLQSDLIDFYVHFRYNTDEITNHEGKQSMNQKELSELRRRWRLDKNAVSRIYGCFVNSAKEIVADLNESLGMLPQEEAEKYLNYPYVWGGSNPSTSFDCSGFVSYVLTNSGLVNTGRLGAQGLYNVCTPVSRANAQPGDLIFFVGTYDTPGVSHVGIYVGDGVMLHCGDPIQYTSINTSYWQSHFYAFGRPNY